MWFWNLLVGGQLSKAFHFNGRLFKVRDTCNSINTLIDANPLNPLKKIYRESLKEFV